MVFNFKLGSYSTLAHDREVNGSQANFSLHGQGVGGQATKDPGQGGQDL